MNSKRKLAFERLESKVFPSAVQMLLAPTGELDRQSETESQAEYWQYQHSAESIIQFVATNARDARQDSGAWDRPSSEQCSSADEMMKLHDGDLRALVIAESLESQA